MSLKKTIVLIVFQCFFCFHAFSQLNANYYLAQARVDMDNEKYFDAIQKLDICISTNPNLQAYFFRGVCKYYLKDDIGAEEDLNLAVSIYDPFLSDAIHYRSFVKYQLGDYDGAIKDINQLLITEANNPKLYLERAFDKLADQDFSGAISDCYKAEKMQLANADLYLCKGMSENAINKFDSALVNYAAALKFNPKNEDVIVRIGITYAEMGNYKKAILKYNETLHLDSANTLAYFSRAEVEMKLNQNDSAMDDLSEVIKFDSKNALAYFDRAILESNKSNYSNALADFGKVLKLNPKNIQALFNSAKLKCTMNDYAGALADYNKTIELFPNFIEAYYERGKLKETMHDYSGAKADYSLAKMMSDVNKYEDKDERQRDSTDLNKLMALNTNFNSNVQQLIDTTSINLMPLFFIIVKKNNNDGAIPLVLRNSNQEYANLYLTNKTALMDTSQNNFNELGADSGRKVTALLQNAILKTNMQLFYDANKTYTKIIEEHPDCEAAYFAFAIDLCKEVDMLSLMNTGDDFTSINKTYRVVNDPKIEKYQHALTNFNKIIEKEPDFAFAYYDRAFVKYKLSDIKGAIQDYDKAIKIDPSFSDAYYNRGLLYFCLTDKISACQDFSKAGELGINKAYSLIKICCGGDK